MIYYVYIYRNMAGPTKAALVSFKSFEKSCMQSIMTLDMLSIEMRHSYRLCNLNGKMLLIFWL